MRSNNLKLSLRRAKEKPPQAEWYIGETSCCIRERRAQHIKYVENNDKKPKKMALVAHVVAIEREFNFIKTKVLRKFGPEYY